MAKFKLTLKNSFALVFAFFGSLISPSLQAEDAAADEESKSTPKAAGESAKDQASGSLSAGAIAAAVAAAVRNSVPAPGATLPGSACAGTGV